MPVVNPTPVPALATDLPDPSDRVTYGPRGRAMWDWEVNQLTPGMNQLANATYNNALHAQTMADAAGVTAAFAGVWSGLSGALAAGASVYHPHVDADYWVLLTGVVNVEAHQPGVSAAFAPFSSAASGMAFDNTGTDLAAEDVQEAIVELSERRGIGRNRLINANFLVNQDGVSGTVVLAAGAYGHDQWKAGAAGCTYTFAASGGVTTLTITAGSLIQPIEGIRLQTGTHVLSWVGTAQGKIGAGSFGVSGQTAMVTGGVDLNIEFGVGTLSLPQFEVGERKTLFEHIDISAETVRCLRYYFYSADIRGTMAGFTSSGWGFKAFTYVNPVPFRVVPTATATSTNGGTLAYTMSVNAVMVTSSTATAAVLSSIVTLKLNARM